MEVTVNNLKKLKKARTNIPKMTYRFYTFPFKIAM